MNDLGPVVLVIFVILAFLAIISMLSAPPKTEEDKLLEKYKVNPDSFKLLPPPKEKQSYGAITAGCFVAAVMCLFTMINAPGPGTGFGFLVVTVGLVSFGIYFLKKVDTSSENFLKETERINQINDQRIQAKQKTVAHYLAIDEAAKAAELRDAEIKNKLAKEKTALIDTEIIHSNEGEARQAQVPVTTFTAVRTQDFADRVALVNYRGKKAIDREDEQLRQENKNQADKVAAFNVIKSVDRTNYDQKSTELLAAKYRLMKDIANIRNNESIPEWEKTIDIQEKQAQIENKELQLRELQAGLLQNNDGQKVRGLSA